MVKNYLNMSLENIEGEVWKDVKGWEGLYCVSNLARAKRLDRYVYSPRWGYALLKEKILKQNIERGYLNILLYRTSDETLKTSLHRLVAINFIPNPENKRTVNHIDCDKKNNHISNLEWASDSENQLHAVANSLRVNTIGEMSNLSKLTTDEVIQIRLLGVKRIRAVEIADNFGITDKSVRDILKRKTWKHI